MYYLKSDKFLFKELYFNLKCESTILKYEKFNCTITVLTKYSYKNIYSFKIDFGDLDIRYYKVENSIDVNKSYNLSGSFVIKAFLEDTPLNNSVEIKGEPFFA